MQSVKLQNESLVEIATFLVRRWSERDNIIVEISDKTERKQGNPDSFREESRKRFSKVQTV